jgi:hypothetical protein
MIIEKQIPIEKVVILKILKCFLNHPEFNPSLIKIKANKIDDKAATVQSAMVLMLYSVLFIIPP